MKKSKCLILLCMGALVLGGCNLNSGGSSSSSSASSSESSSTKEEGASIYALIGDFKDASWVDSPSEGSSYYLDSSVTTYWERTVVTSSQEGSRENARLAIVDYGTYDIVAGYTALTSNSSGAFEDSGTNYIGLYWDSTYRVEIDFTNNSKSITITLVSGGPTEGGESGSSSESGESGSSSSENNPGGTTETAYYSLVGDFIDNPEWGWNGWPEEGSPYRLDYTVGKDSTKYWEREVTISETEQTWNASLYVAYVYYDENAYDGEGGDIWDVVLGYSDLDIDNSTGVLGQSNAGGIEVQWGKTYELVMDMTSTNPSITVNLVTEGGEGDDNDDPNQGEGSTYDSAYTIYGEFTDDNNWNPDPAENLDVYLPFNSNYPETKKWTRTLSTPAAPTTDESWEQYGPWDPSFRITTTGSYEEIVTVAGYTELDSASTGVEDWGNEENNEIQLLYWEATYTITIDLTGETGSILVTYDTSSGGTHYEEEESSQESAYDSNYVLTGDLVGASWIGWAEEGSDYYLGFNSNDPDSMYWERTITILEEPEDKTWWNPDTGNTWNAGFRVVSVYYDESEPWTDDNGDTQYGADVWTTIAGYTELDTSKSSGYIGAGDDNNIAVTWGATYDVTIDCRGATPVLTINLASDTGDSGNTGDTGSGSGSDDYQAPTDVTYDTYYVLYGAFNGASWNASPTKQTNTGFALGFDSRYPESRYWTRTVTLTSTDGFRIIDYGSYNSLVAGYSNFEIDSASSGLNSESDGDNNFKFSSTGTYDLTIDMRTGNYTILVQPHSSSSTFLESDGNYTENPSAFLNNYSSLNVGDDYIMGADISSIAEVEAAGGKFYDYEGKEVDCIQYLASQGINYARLRLWVDPTDGSGNSYQGGGNDITTDIAIAKRCVDAGMKICLDLHYSDFWTHRGQQFAPKSWTSYSGQTLYSAASSWTTTVLGQLETAGCPISMVQVGNETNNNAVCGTSGTDFFKECCCAVKSYSNTNHSDDPIKIVIHYALDQDINTYKSYYNALINASVDFDVIGLSYYPYYHLSKGSLDSVLSSLTTSYPTKDFCVMEYSSGWTLTYPWDNQGTYGTTSNTFGTSQVSAGGYGASVSEQTRCIYDINKSVASIGSQGLGTFYWEPAWLARSGTSWASSYAEGYYTSNNSSLSGADVTTWSNQALFDYRGYALDSLKIYNIMK